MALKDENILGLVENLSKVLNTVLFTGLKIDVKDYENYKELFSLKKGLKKDIEEGKLAKAQEDLFKEMEQKNYSHDILRVAFWFYLKLNSLDEEVLKKGGFEKKDIAYGMKKIEESVF